MTTTGLFDDTTAMVIVAVGVVLMFVFIWLLMRKYKQKHGPSAMHGTSSHLPTLLTSVEVTALPFVESRAFADTSDVVGTAAANKAPEPTVLQQLPAWITSPRSEPGQIPLSNQPAPHEEGSPAKKAEEKPKRRGSSGKKRKESPDNAPPGAATDLNKQPVSPDQGKPKGKKPDHGYSHGLEGAVSPTKRKTKRKHSKSTAPNVTQPQTTSPLGPQTRAGASAAPQPDSGTVAAHAQPRPFSGAEDPDVRELQAAITLRQASRVYPSALKPDRRKPSIHQLDIFSAEHPTGHTAEGNKAESDSRESPMKTTGWGSSSITGAPTFGANAGGVSSSAGHSSQSKSPDDDSAVLELRDLHAPRASRVPQALSPNERHRVDVSKVPDMLDIFSAEHSTL